MKYWLFKTEPDAFSFDDLLNEGPSGWDGVRNYQARNRLRDQLAIGDRVLIQHSGTGNPAIVGLAEVVSASYPDPSQFDRHHPGHDPKSTTQAPRWFQVDVRALRRLRHPLPLKVLRDDEALAESEPVRRARLSVQALSRDEFHRILTLAGETP
jgi:predicted RNA-binding protein with PUA-like domain